MKYIFDFDDVIFHTTRHRKEHMFPLLEKAGISNVDIEEYYKKTRLEGFSLKDTISYFLPHKKDVHEKLYEEVMTEGKKFINTEIIEIIKKLGKENCFLITHGGDEFQKDKISRARVQELFSEITILVGSKKEAVEKICASHKDEEVIFIDDKPQYFENLDFKKYPNLKTILYTGQDLSYLLP